jgi:DNA-binding transcriptional LysR family regulator
MARAPSDTLLTGTELSAFVAVVEAGSLAGAADVLDLTTSAVTKRLQALERHVGVRLLERGHFGARLTDAGSLLYPDARSAVDALQRVYNLVRPEGVDVPIRLGASHTIGEFLLPLWIASYRSQAGPLRVRADIVNSRCVRKRVADGSVDIGFIEDSEGPSGADLLPLQRDEIVVVVAHRHRWAGMLSVAPDALQSVPYCTRERGSGTRAVAESALSRIGITLSPRLEVASTQSLKRALLEDGFALLSRLVVDQEVSSGTLCALRVEGVALERTLGAIRSLQRDLPPATERFWDWLSKTVDVRNPRLSIGAKGRPGPAC